LINDIVGENKKQVDGDKESPAERLKKPVFGQAVYPIEHSSKLYQ
jgi:hypothetical protein